MTKKQRQAQKSVLEIMATARRTQQQLAKDIGASVNTVKSWTRKKNPRPVSSDLKKRIYGAYGAMIGDDGKLFSISSEGKEQPFTKEALEDWRKHRVNSKRPHYSGRSIVNYFVSRGIDSMSRIFHAASEKDNGRTDKLFAVVESFNQWAASAIKDFKLSKSNEFNAKYRAIMKSVAPEDDWESLPPDYASNHVIEKGSPRWNQHVDLLKALAKKGDKAAIANLELYNIEVGDVVEPPRR